MMRTYCYFLIFSPWTCLYDSIMITFFYFSFSRLIFLPLIGSSLYFSLFSLLRSWKSFFLFLYKTTWKFLKLLSQYTVYYTVYTLLISQYTNFQDFKNLHGNYILSKAPKIQRSAKIILIIYPGFGKSICIITFCPQFYVILDNFYKLYSKTAKV